MKNWKHILFMIIAIGGLIVNIYEGSRSDFHNGYYNIISFFLLSVLAISKFTKHPL